MPPKSNASKTAKKRQKDGKFLETLAPNNENEFKANSSDVIIPVMGPTGVGKSTFINNVVGHRKVKVGDNLESQTVELEPVVIQFGQQSGFSNPYESKDGRLVLVDTPGFDDTYVDDAEILERISVWLAKSYHKEAKLGGVIYLHDITQTRMLGTTRKNLDMFRKLIGKDALRSVVLGTTKWALVTPDVGLGRQKQLEDQFWKEMIQAGSKIERIDSKDAPCKLVREVLLRLKNKKLADQFLTIQDELVNVHKFVPETEAGQTLKYSLEEIIEQQRKRAQRLREQTQESNDPAVAQEFQQGMQTIANLLATAKKLKVPLTKRLMRFFL
ncbi:hypothetical protein BDN70DRAFT_872688 [Pholiota conissans]|uniref:G domain-containing protein n=1 Tax=Pholiota conissans TaxID=109636 RepID=A0A9P5ZEE3_9AGAR|nr:hypothetical protein BDN70DRAFT_872688 [Pholiota conissans]